MAEYIEREALIAQYDKEHVGAPGRARQLMVEAPTADVAEVKHGEWLINSDGYYPYCSECGAEPIMRIMSKFCPNCGAKMMEDE